MNDTCILIKFNYARSTKPRIVRMDVQNYDCISVYPIQLSQHVISKEETRRKKRSLENSQRLRLQDNTDFDIVSFPFETRETKIQYPPRSAKRC